MKSVAFIPARSGSKRINDKNIKLLDGHPLIAYTIEAAKSSNVFDSIICATDSQEYATIAENYGAEVPFLRPSEISNDKSPDIDWVIYFLEYLKKENRNFEVYSILRPTSPFRKSETIKRAYTTFQSDSKADSLRAIEKCLQHPGKMWSLNQNKSRMHPIFPFENNGTPWHSNQYSALPEIYVQNASLEIAWVDMTLNKKSISGDSIIPFITEGYEGFDINYIEDWFLAEYIIRENLANLPHIDLKSK